MRPFFRYFEFLFIVVLFGGSAVLISSSLVTCINRQHSASTSPSSQEVQHFIPQIPLVSPFVEMVFRDGIYTQSSFDDNRIYFYAYGWQEIKQLYALNRITGNFERPVPAVSSPSLTTSWVEVSSEMPQCYIGDAVLIGDNSYKISQLTENSLIGIFTAEVGNSMRQIQWNCLTGALNVMLPDGTLRPQGFSLNYK